MGIRAKFRCFSVSTDGANETVQLSAVYGSSDKPANAEWSKATPSGSLTMTISNPAAQGFFKPTKEYFLDFTAEEA